MNFDKDYNREEKINLAKKKLKKFRKYHNVSSGEPSRESLNTDSSQSQSFSIPGTPNANNNLNPLSPSSYYQNNNVSATTQNNTQNNYGTYNNNSTISNSTVIDNTISNSTVTDNSTNSNINNNVNQVQTYNTNESSQFTGVSNTESNSNTQYTNPVTSAESTIANMAIYSNSTTNDTAVDYTNGYSTQNNYYSNTNTYSYPSTTQNSYYPMDNTYSYDSSNANVKAEEKKQTESRPSIRAGFSFVGSMFKNIIEAAAPPINPEYLQKYKNSQSSSLNSLNDDDNGMGNNYLVNKNSNINETSTGVNPQVESVKNEEPEYMKSIGNNSGASTPLFIQNSNLINGQTAPPTTAVAPSQYIRSMPKKKKKWASFQYNEGEIVVDRENYSKNPANNISLKDYMSQQQQKQSSETSNSVAPPKATTDTLTTNMFVPAPPKIENSTSDNNTNMLSPLNSNIPNSNNNNNNTFLLSPSVASNISSSVTPPPPMASASGISSSVTPPPPMASASGISASLTPPPPMTNASGISATPTPPPPMANATPTPPPPMAGASGISATPTPPPPMAGTSRISATPTPPPPMAGASRIGATPTPPPPMAGASRIGATPTPPPPMAGSYNMAATPTPPPPKTSNYSGFSIPTPNNGFSIPTPSNPMTNNTTTGGLYDTTINQTSSMSGVSNQIFNTATVIPDEKESSIDNGNENNSKIPSVVGIIEENDNILLSSPHIDGSVLRNNNDRNLSKYKSKTSFSTLISNPDVIELTSNSNSTTPADKLGANDTSDLFDSVGTESVVNDNNSSVMEFSNDVNNENLSDILLNNHLKGKKKSKKSYPMPLSDIMASPFGVYSKISLRENSDNKLSEVASLDLEPLSIDSNRNDSYSETVSPDDTSSIFGVPKKSKEANESSSLNQSFVPSNDNDEQQSSPVVVKQKPANDSLLFASNADGTNNNTNIMTDMQNKDNNDLPFNLIDDLENVSISENNKMKKAPFNKEISLVSPDKINEMSDIPLDENVPEKSTRQFFTSKILSETAKAKNLLSGMFPIKDNKSEGSVGKLVNLAFSSHSETNELSEPTDISKPDGVSNDSILKPSSDVKNEQNVLFTGSPENNDHQGLFINQLNEKDNASPLFVNTSDTPKQEVLFATPIEQRKTSVLYGTDIDNTSSLFGNDNQANNQQQDGFMSYFNQNNNTEFPIQTSQDNSNQINTIPLDDNQNKATEVQENNIPFYSSGNNTQDNTIPLFSSDNNTGNVNVQDNNNVPFYASGNENQNVNVQDNNNVPFYASGNENQNVNVQDNNNVPFYASGNENQNVNVQDSNIPFFASVDTNTNFGINTQDNTSSLFTQNDNNISYNQNNNVPLYSNDNSNPATKVDDIYNQSSPAKFYISSGNATPLSNDMYNNSASFPISNTTSPIKNEIVEPAYGNEISLIGQNDVTQSTFSNVNSGSNVQNEAVPFFANSNEESNKVETFPYFNSENNTSTMNQQNDSIPFFSSNNQALGNNEIQQPTNIFDSLSNQNNTNVSFFDNQNNNSNNTGANWFEQFSQNNEPLVLSNESQIENIKQEETQKSPEVQETKVISDIVENQDEKQTDTANNQDVFGTEPVPENKIDEQNENIIEQVNEVPAITSVEKDTAVPDIKPLDNTELLKLQDELDEINKKLQDKTALITDLNSQIDQQKEQNTNLNGKLLDLEKMNSENKEKINQQEKTIDQLNSLIKMKDQQIELLKEENEGELNNKDNATEMNKMNDLLNEKIVIIEQLTNENNNLVTENNSQKQLIESKDNEIKDYQDKLKQLNEEIEKIKSSSGSTEKQIKDLQDLIGEKEKQINDLSNEKESLENETKKQMEDAKNSYIQLENNCSILQEEIKKCKEENATLEQEITLIKCDAEKINENRKEESEFVQKVKELYPNLTFGDIINKISNLNSEREVVQPNPIDPSKTSNIQELNWNEMSNGNKDESENDYIKDNNLNVFTPQPFLQMNDEQIKKYEDENNDLKQKCSAYQEAMEKDKAEIEYLKEIIKNQKITQLPQLALNDGNGENHSLIEIIDQLTKDNQALSLQVQELRHEVDSNNQANTSMTYSKSPFENINTSSSFSYPSYLDTTQPPNDLMYNQLYTSTAVTGSILDNRVYENDMNYYDTSRISNFTTPSTTFDHQQLLNQLDEREKNERNKMLASTNMGPSQTDLLYMQKYNPYNNY